MIRDAWHAEKFQAGGEHNQTGRKFTWNHLLEAPPSQGHFAFVPARGFESSFGHKICPAAVHM